MNMILYLHPIIGRRPIIGRCLTCNMYVGINMILYLHPIIGRRLIIGCRLICYMYVIVRRPIIGRCPIQVRRPTNSIRLLLLVPVDDVEESSRGVVLRQFLQGVVRPKRHGLLITAGNEGDFPFAGEVVIGVCED
jgi:hypothetical protein